MGTSTDYAGSPKWGPSRSETTRAAGEGHVTPQKAASIVGGYVDQMTRSSNCGFGEPLSSSGSGAHGTRGTGGGRTGGSLPRMRGSARTVARALGSFLADVKARGFREALAEHGLTDLSGKSADEIALALADLLGGPSSLIDETALRDALMALMLKWSEDAAGADELADTVSEVAENIEVALRDFLGFYIVEVFKTVGYQGVLETHGFEKAEAMAGQIRDFVDAKLAAVEASRPLSAIDWNGAAGAQVVDRIVANTVEIFGEAQP